VYIGTLIVPSWHDGVLWPLPWQGMKIIFRRTIGVTKGIRVIQGKKKRNLGIS
jgi:hypothetical protein